MLPAIRMRIMDNRFKITPDELDQLEDALNEPPKILPRLAAFLKESTEEE